ncbi:sensor histidine kinase [Ramlibacter sp. G-1-2-2]|uniref:histidine kinase n=1 Tax=Ramlibacter agri TaxID=2728837 RepID=A0A848H941_9BURK|nr:sensor histidine kinase [Ramlibacter agri]NML47014.1 sensor histidine kinase [Ramlibacter agri]
MTEAPRPPSLVQRLLRTVLLPLGLMWVAGTVVSFAVAQYFAQHAFDRSLLDDAYLLSAHVRPEHGQLTLDLTPKEVNTILYDQDETMYFSVRGPDGQVLAGDPGLAPNAHSGPAYEFADIAFAGKILRSVTLHNGLPARFDVVVAQTTNERNAVLRELMFYSLLPQIALLALLWAWLRRSIRRDVQPLSTLQKALGNRSSEDLSPVPTEASTRDLQALGLAINALLQRLDRSIRAQKEFAGNVAHELRTPLAGIRALAEYGLGHAEPEVWRQQLVAIAGSEVRATSLVDRLLAMAVAAEAESGLRLQPLALDAAVRDCVLRFIRRADEAGVDLGARGIDQPVWVAAEPTLLDGILTNLIDNALRYGVSASVAEPAVTVAVEQAGDEVRLSVQDNGPGAPHEQQVELADRGTQGEAGQLLGQGAGLGLALVAQYARLMNARMALRSGEDGRGWVCEITFRAVASPAS